VGLRLGLPQVLERRDQGAVVAGRRGHDVLQLGLGPHELVAVVELAPQLALHEQAGGLERHELPVEALGGVEVLEIERQAHERAQRLLLVGLRREQGQRLLVAGERVGRVAAVLVQVGEREDGGGVAGLERHGLPERLDGVVDAAVDAVQARQRHGGRILVGPGLRGALLEVGDELGDVAVALAVQLRQALQRERRPRLRQDDAGVPLEQHGLRRASRGGRGGPWRRRGTEHPPRLGTVHGARRGAMPSVRVEILPGRGPGQRDHRRHEHEQDPP
jgi:hypothetical protein